MAAITGPDGKARCRWSGAAPEFLGYHDTEWGFRVADDHRLLEKLCLEGFQSGLSWRTILAKRDNFRDRKSTRLNSSHSGESRMPSSA